VRSTPFEDHGNTSAPTFPLSVRLIKDFDLSFLSRKVRQKAGHWMKNYNTAHLPPNNSTLYRTFNCGY
jgi:hypothetical protein